MAGLCGFTLLAISLSDSGDAAYPGANGKIAFASGDAYKWSIWTANADGSSPTPLTASSTDHSPSYSADGSRIAFNREGSVVVMGANGSSPTQLVTGSYASDVQTTWQSNYDDPDSSKVIPEVKIQTRTESGEGFYDPSFSPDGSQLAVSKSVFDEVVKSVCAVETAGDAECLDYSDPDAYFDFEFSCTCQQSIVTISSTTGATTAQVTTPGPNVSDFDPSYGVNGKIAFDRSTNTMGASGIFVVDSPGAPPLQLTSGYSSRDPDFSPDGSRVVFQNSPKSFGVVPASGGAITQISAPAPPAGLHSNNSSPAFSPDGTQLIFRRILYASSGPVIEQGLFEMGLDGSGFRRVAEGYDPAWQPAAPAPPPPPPVVKPKAKVKKGKVKLNKKNEAVVGSIVCGSSPCSLKTILAKLKLGKEKCGVQAKAPKKLGTGASAKVKAAVKGKCLIKLEKAGKGTLLLKIKVTSANGTETLTLKVTLVPGAKDKPKGKGKGKKGGK